MLLPKPSDKVNQTAVSLQNQDTKKKIQVEFSVNVFQWQLCLAPPPRCSVDVLQLAACGGKTSRARESVGGGCQPYLRRDSVGRWAFQVGGMGSTGGN